MTDLATFLAVLFTQPLRRCDACVVLTGEDTDARLQVGLQLMRQQAAPVLVLAGGRSDPPRIHDAHYAAKEALAAGFDPARIVVEDQSQNTYEQACNVVTLAEERGWKSLLLVASAYHLPRAFLTFTAALGSTGPALCPVAASQSPWWGDPCRVTRWAIERDKMERYRDHVASIETGLAYLKQWEGKAA